MVLLALFGRKECRLLIMLVVVLCGCFVLKHPILEALNVTPGDPMESLSVPVQQISRAVVDGIELSDEQRELLEKVVDVDRIPDTYAMWISDPMKDLVRERENQDYLLEHKAEYLKLYVQLFLKYPISFVNGWVEQTKGYWNDGYEYWRWITADNDYFSKGHYGIVHTVKSQTAVNVIAKMAALADTPILKPFLCIGLYSWMLLFCMYAAFVRRDRASWFTAVLPAMILGTLMVATPVFSEFRYAYGVIASIPMVLAACFCPGKENP